MERDVVSTSGAEARGAAIYAPADKEAGKRANTWGYQLLGILMIEAI
jgi:hypothetical protein